MSDWRKTVSDLIKKKKAAGEKIDLKTVLKEAKVIYKKQKKGGEGEVEVEGQEETVPTEVPPTEEPTEAPPTEEPIEEMAESDAESEEEAETESVAPTSEVAFGGRSKKRRTMKKNKKGGCGCVGGDKVTMGGSVKTRGMRIQTRGKGNGRLFDSSDLKALTKRRNRKSSVIPATVVDQPTQDQGQVVEDAVVSASPAPLESMPMKRTQRRSRGSSAKNPKCGKEYVIFRPSMHCNQLIRTVHGMGKNKYILHEGKHLLLSSIRGKYRFSEHKPSSHYSH